MYQVVFGRVFSLFTELGTHFSMLVLNRVEDSSKCSEESLKAKGYSVQPKYKLGSETEPDVVQTLVRKLWEQIIIIMYAQKAFTISIRWVSKKNFVLKEISSEHLFRQTVNQKKEGYQLRDFV